MITHVGSIPTVYLCGHEPTFMATSSSTHAYVRNHPRAQSHAIQQLPHVDFRVDCALNSVALLAPTETPAHGPGNRTQPARSVDPSSLFCGWLKPGLVNPAVGEGSSSYAVEWRCGLFCSHRHRWPTFEAFSTRMSIGKQLAGVRLYPLIYARNVEQVHCSSEKFGGSGVEAMLIESRTAL